MALVITLLLGMFFIIGILVVSFAKNAHTIEHYSVATALGAMVGIGLLDILPELIEMITPSMIFLPIIGVVVGFGILVGLDKFIPEHEDDDENEYSDENMVHIGMISSIAIIIHNIIEGMAVYSMASQNINEGLLLMVGIGLHNIPMGMFIYSTLRSKTGWKKNTFLAASTLSTFIGGIIMMVLESYLTVAFDEVLYGVALGMIAYIVIMELIPYVRRNKSKITTAVCSAIGLAVVLISTIIE